MNLRVHDVFEEATVAAQLNELILNSGGCQRSRRVTGERKVVVRCRRKIWLVSRLA